MTNTMQCAFCGAGESKYSCPRCQLSYCRLDCYKSEKHLKCSEEFYKRCVQEEMSSQRSTGKEQQKMREILLRQRQETEQDATDTLANKLDGVDLDDTEQVLEALSEEQRKTFHRLVSSNEIAKYITVWKPWWLESSLIEVVEPSSDPMEGFHRQKREKRPKIGGKKVLDLRRTEQNIEVNNGLERETPESDWSPVEAGRHNDGTLSIGDISAEQVGERTDRTRIVDSRYLDRKSRKAATPQKVDSRTTELNDSEMAKKAKLDLEFSTERRILLDNLIGEIEYSDRVRSANLINVFTSFAFVARFFNGDLSVENAVDAANTVIRICAVLGKQRNFEEINIAMADVFCQELVVRNSCKLTIGIDARKIMGNKKFGLKLISECRILFKRARNQLKDVSPDSAKRMKMITLKLDFYSDWLEKEYSRVMKYSIPMIDLEIRAYDMKSSVKNTAS